MCLPLLSPAVEQLDADNRCETVSLPRATTLPMPQHLPAIPVHAITTLPYATVPAVLFACHLLGYHGSHLPPWTSARTVHSLPIAFLPVPYHACTIPPPPLLRAHYCTLPPRSPRRALLTVYHCCSILFVASVDFCFGSACSHAFMVMNGSYTFLLCRTFEHYTCVRQFCRAFAGSGTSPRPVRIYNCCYAARACSGTGPAGCA